MPTKPSPTMVAVLREAAASPEGITIYGRAVVTAKVLRKRRLIMLWRCPGTSRMRRWRVVLLPAGLAALDAVST